MAVRSPMTTGQKLFFFCIAVCAMACMAICAIFIGQADYVKSVVFLLLGLVLVGVGFMTRKRILKQSGTNTHS